MESGLTSKILSKINVIVDDLSSNQSHINIEKTVCHDLPDGSCFSRALPLDQKRNLNDAASIKKCDYVGSFEVSGSNRQEISEYVRNQLKSLQDTGPRKSVIIVISQTGIKVCNSDGQSVLMAHALRRISFATCDPENRLFSFLAREPNGNFNIQYCHSFLAKDPQVAEQLSAVVSGAFRMAYAQQRRQLTGASPMVPRVAPTTPRQHWAKKLIGKISHTDPLVSHAMELGNWFNLSSSSSSANTQQSPLSSKNLKGSNSQTSTNNANFSGYTGPSSSANSDSSVNTQQSALSNGRFSEVTQQSVFGNSHFTDDHHMSSPKTRWFVENPQQSPVPNSSFEENLEDTFNESGFEEAQTSNTSDSGRGISHSSSFDLSPLNCSYSSDDNNTPNDVNSCKQAQEKPTMSKNLDAVKENEKTPKSMRRSSSGEFVNETRSFGKECVCSCQCRLMCGSRDEKMLIKENNGTMNNCPAPSAPARDDHEEYSLNRAAIENQSQTAARCIIASAFKSVIGRKGLDESDCWNSHEFSGASGNRAIKPPTPPKRHDSLDDTLEEKDLRDAPWFQAGIPREIALEILTQEPVGSFMVRESTSKPGCFALSMHVPRNCHHSGIVHYLIMHSSRGYKIKGFTKEFPTLTGLITHHSVMPELLPCTLSLARNNPTYTKYDDMVYVDEDPDYNLSSNFRKMWKHTKKRMP